MLKAKRRVLMAKRRVPTGDATGCSCGDATDAQGDATSFPHSHELRSFVPSTHMIPEVDGRSPFQWYAGSE